ncbi:MAG: hypothetical protein LBC68_05290, partial [Prevotellaceae bacterium]|nr:hypothetical protein [Prevotellaceae bacterium]
MKNIILITTTLLFVMCNFCVAQEKIKLENVNVNEENISDALPRNAVYIFPDFIKGKVFFDNGATSTADLNYNTLLSEMQFLDKDSNILSLANPQDVTYITVGKKVFYYVSDKAFGELIVNSDNIKLCVKRRTEYTETKSQGAYGQSNITSAITNINSLNQFKHSELSVFRDLEFIIKDEFLLEKNGKFTKISNAKSFVKAFPNYKEEITRFVETNKTNFKNEKDLIKLTNYCIQLSL